MNLVVICGRFLARVVLTRSLLIWFRWWRSAKYCSDVFVLYLWSWLNEFDVAQVIDRARDGFEHAFTEPQLLDELKTCHIGIDGVRST